MPSSPGRTFQPRNCLHNPSGFTESSAGWHLVTCLNSKQGLIKWLSYSSLLLSLSSVPRESWLAISKNKISEENCLPTAASVSLASSADSWALALELLKNLFWAELLVGSQPPRCRFLLLPLNWKAGFVYIYPSENLLLCKYLKLRPPWEGTYDTCISFPAKYP